MQTRFSLLLVTSLAISVATASSDISWPEWRGPDRDARVDYFDPPAEWPRSARSAWKLSVGNSSGSPLVSNGRAYLNARQGGAEIVRCIDLETGEIIWNQSVPIRYRIQSPGERFGSGPNSTPALADNRLFTLSVTGILSAWDASSGDLLWRRDYADRFRQTHPAWGHSTSPLVIGDTVVVHFGGAQAGVLAALNVETGNEVWTEGEDGISHASPILVELHGVQQIVEWNHESVVGVESQTGRRLWDYPLPHQGSNQNSPTPVHHEGRIIIGGENRGIRSLEPRLQNGKWSVEEVWHQRRVSLNMASAVIGDDGSLYGLSHFRQGLFFRLDPETGEILWLGPSRTGEYATFLTIPGFVVALRDDGRLEVIPTNQSEYRTVATYEVSNRPTWTAPVLLNDGFLIKDHSTLARWVFE